MCHRADESPFDNPTLMEGYPLDKAERDELDRAIHDLDQSIPAADGRSVEPAERAVERPAATEA